MDLLDFLSMISTFATIETRIRELILNSKKRSNKKDIKNIELDVRECLKFEDNALGKIDDFISKHAELFKDFERGVIFSDTDKERFIQDFFKKNNDLYAYKGDVEYALNIYIDKLEQRISTVLSPGEKMIMRTMNEMKTNFENIDEKVDKIINVFEEKEYGKKVFSESKYNKACIVLLKEIDALIEKNIGNKIFKKSIRENYLVADNFENTILRLQEVFRSIDIDYINMRTKSKYNDGFEAFRKFIKTIASDLMISINEKYDYKINMVICCINEFEQKGEKYYLSLGALGLFNDYSDEAIYLCVMDILFSYLKEIRDVLIKKWKKRNYKLLENKAQAEMQEYLWQQIRYSITSINKEWILDILNTGKISDAEIAQKYNRSVKDIRKELYDAAKTFLNHSYIDDYTTMMSIKDEYKEIVRSRLGGHIEN